MTVGELRKSLEPFNSLVQVRIRKESADIDYPIIFVTSESGDIMIEFRDTEEEE